MSASPLPCALPSATTSHCTCVQGTTASLAPTAARAPPRAALLTSRRAPRPQASRRCPGPAFPHSRSGPPAPGRHLQTALWTPAPPARSASTPPSTSTLTAGLRASALRSTPSPPVRHSPSPPPMATQRASRLLLRWAGSYVRAASPCRQTTDRATPHRRRGRAWRPLTSPWFEDDGQKGV